MRCAGGNAKKSTAAEQVNVLTLAFILPAFSLVITFSAAAGTRISQGSYIIFSPVYFSAIGKPIIVPRACKLTPFKTAHPSKTNVQIHATVPLLGAKRIGFQEATMSPAIIILRKATFSNTFLGALGCPSIPYPLPTDRTLKGHHLMGRGNEASEVEKWIPKKRPFVAE